jgi:uncharacterized cupredoxin-like copper-binding protein
MSSDLNNLPHIFLTAILGLITSLSTYADVVDHSHDHEANTGKSEETTIGYAGKNAENLIDRTIEVTALDIEFIPSTIYVKRGETIKFLVTNKGNLPHEFVLGTEADQREHHSQMNNMMNGDMAHHMQDQSNGILLSPGEGKEIVWTFQTELEQLQFACNVPGHYEAGMFGYLIINLASNE